MSHLTVELLLTFLLVAAIGWFLGRYLCKSGEYEERAQNQQQGKQLGALRSELHSREQTLEEARDRINLQGKQNAELAQQKEGLNAQLGSLYQERDKLLLKLQELQVCNSRLTTLTGELDLHRQHMQELQTERNTLAGQLGTLQEVLNHTNEQLAQTHQHNQEQLTELKQLRTENTHQAQMITALEKDRQELQQARLQNEEARLRINGLEYEKQIQEGRFTTLQHEHEQLLQQCQSLRQDTLEFNDRLNNLMKERDKLGHETERLRIEKQDYIGRLRAISNVVDAISEMHVAPVLIEQWQPENEHE